jgi:hypothetical protein
MDAIRQIRFVTPALFFIGILVLGALFESPISLKSLQTLPAGGVAAVIGAVLAALFPIGFAIGAVTSLALRALFYVCRKDNYQIHLSDIAWSNIWRALRLNTDLPATPSHKLYAAMTFDHELLSEGIHQTSVRLWSAFNIAANSTMALLLSCAVNQLWLHIRWTQSWMMLIASWE